jgi:squalene synthase HpnC
VSVLPDRLARAYSACEGVVRAHDENFPVASRLLPAAMRPHVAAVYAFSRLADDLADEGDLPASVRQARLRVWHERLRDAVASARDDRASKDRDDLVFAALGHTIQTFDLPLSPFDDLLSAFGQDTTTTRYDSWRDLLDYCRRSANPVGRLVLRIAGYGDSALDQSSDALCTALQLTNFWQDFGRDWRAGRLYVPGEVQRAAGADEHDLAQGRLTTAWARAIDACAEKTRARFEEGRAVCDGVKGRLRLELRLTWLGGNRVLRKVARRRFELLSHRPALGAEDLPALVGGALAWRRSGA